MSKYCIECGIDIEVKKQKWHTKCYDCWCEGEGYSDIERVCLEGIPFVWDSWWDFNGRGFKTR